MGRTFRFDMTTLPQIQPMTGAELKAIREGFGLSQERFARLLDCATQTIRLWEAGNGMSIRATLAVERLEQRLKQAAQQSAPEPAAKSARKSSTINRKG